MELDLFFSSNKELEKEVLKVNIKHPFEINQKGLIEDVDGFFLYYNTREKTLYLAEIRSIKIISLEEGEEINGAIDNLSCVIQFKNGLFNVEFKKPLEKKPDDTLKFFYAQRNKKRMQDPSFSIYYTIKKQPFPYSLPCVDELKYAPSRYFKKQILYKNKIIPKDKKKEKTFAEIINEDGEYLLTLTNEKMLKMDYEFIIEEKHREYFRPYFYELTLTDDSQRRLEKQLDTETYTVGKLYEVEIFEMENVKGNLNTEYFQGELIFSASPSKRVPVYISNLLKDVDESIAERNEKIAQQIEKSMVVKSNKNINTIKSIFENEIAPIKGENVKFEVKIHNVGQGNWIHILISENNKLKSTLVLDIGTGNHSDHALLNLISERAAAEIQGDYFFMLSHWDLDHIKGVVNLEKEQFETTWFVPQISKKIKKLSKSAQRLAAYLTVSPQINMVVIADSLNGTVIFENENFILGKGKGDNIGKSTKYGPLSYTAANNLGLILILKKYENNVEKKMLLPGDCEYAGMPDSFVNNQEYEAMVVSHHGAKIEPYLTNMGFIQSKKDKFAVVCVGKKTKYPVNNHIKDHAC